MPSLVPNSEKYFCDLLAELHSKLKPKIPSLALSKMTGCGITDSHWARNTCKKARDKAKSDEGKKAMSKALATPEQALT